MKDYGLALKKRIGSYYVARHCKKGEILEVEGQEARRAHVILKGSVKIYKKLINDELRDTNSRRREKRSLLQNQKPMPPAQSPKLPSITLNNMGAALPSILEERVDDLEALAAAPGPRYTNGKAAGREAVGEKREA